MIPVEIQVNACQFLIRKFRRRNWQFTDWKTGIFCSGKEIKELRGSVRLKYAAQARPQIDSLLRLYLESNACCIGEVVIKALVAVAVVVVEIQNMFYFSP